MKQAKESHRERSLTERYPELAALAENRRGLPELASALIQLRARTGKKQSELASAAGITATLLSELENARNEGVSWRTLVRLAKGAGASLHVTFNIDQHCAGLVDVHVEGEYAHDDAGEVRRMAELINERNDAMRPFGCLAA